jgi:YD repeat-containing protein
LIRSGVSILPLVCVLGAVCDHEVQLPGNSRLVRNNADNILILTPAAVTQVTDRKGQVTAYQYGCVRPPHARHLTNADASTTQFVYDAGDRITQIIDSVAGTIAPDPVKTAGATVLFLLRTARIVATWSTTSATSGAPIIGSAISNCSVA